MFMFIPTVLFEINVNKSTTTYNLNLVFKHYEHSSTANGILVYNKIMQYSKSPIALP